MAGHPESPRAQSAGPESGMLAVVTPCEGHRQPATALQVAGTIYDWATCLFVAGMICSQFFGVIASSVDKTMAVSFGRDPALGPFDTQKTNDVPYSDRVVVCLATRDSYKPALLSDVIYAPASPPVVDTLGLSVSGYRVVPRTGGSLDSSINAHYSRVCNTLASTKDGMLDACESLGYHVVGTGLRIVDGPLSNTTVLLDDALPILIMPFWDNAPSARYAIPGSDGSACVLRVSGKYSDNTSTMALVRGIDRSVREEKTAEWLRRPGGQWRNGWYEDLDGMAWYSDVTTSKYGWKSLPRARYFDTLTSTEVDCGSSEVCSAEVDKFHWGPHFTIDVTTSRITSIVIYNATQYGIFWYEATSVLTLSSTYDWQAALANASTAILISRWAVALFALHQGYMCGRSTLYHTGIGALSNSWSFQWLPLLLLPRLKTTLTAFFSVGCGFQGQQFAFSETWFVMYPAIIELVLLYYSVLNGLAKIFRRRVTDALFAPTIAALCALHVLRQSLGQWSWLQIVDNYVPTLVSSDEIAQLQLLQFFTSDIALRLNGGITRLFALKLIIINVSLLPFLLARTLPAQKGKGRSLSGIEKALAVRASNVAGLGRSAVYEIVGDATANGAGNHAASLKSGQVQPAGDLVLNSYELVRLGYVIFGDKYLISMDDWDRVSMLASFRQFYHLWNHRTVVFKIDVSHGLTEVRGNPVLMRVDASELRHIRIWAISTCPLRC